MRLLRHSQEPFGVSGKVHQNSTARLATPLVGADLSDRDLVATGTCIPARLLGWGEVIGTLEAGKRADLIVVHEHTGDPYDKLLSATEADLDLVVIDVSPAPAPLI